MAVQLAIICVEPSSTRDGRDPEVWKRAEDLYDHIETRFSMYFGETPSEILPGLYVGSIRDAHAIDHLKERNITHILNVADVDARLGAAVYEGRAWLEPHPVVFKGFAAEDEEEYDIAQHFDDACAFITDALDGAHNILVHCGAGMSRSVAVTCVYLMRSRHWSALRALLFVNSKRSCARPNRGFIYALLLEEKKMRNSGDAPASAGREQRALSLDETWAASHVGRLRMGENVTDVANTVRSTFFVSA